MNPERLLEQFLGQGAAGRASGALDSAKGKLTESGMGNMAGGLAAGGVLGLLLGNKKARRTIGKMAGGVVGYGAAAGLGALAFRAYQNWQNGQEAQPSATPPPPPGQAQAQLPPPLPEDSKFMPGAAPARDGKPFELALVMAMIAAANADGHVDADEQKSIFDKVGQMPLAAEDKAFVFDALSKPPSLQDIASLAEGQEQAAELYLASRLAIDPDHPMEQAYLEALASRLSLPAELVQHLELQLKDASPA